MKLTTAPLLGAALLVAACGGDSGGASGSSSNTSNATSNAEQDAGQDADLDTAGEPDTSEPPTSWCESATSQRYDPLTREELDVWPDSLWTREDPASPTGQRLQVSDSPWAQLAPEVIARSVTSDLDVLSGFASQGAVFFRFDGALGALPEGVVTDAPGVTLVDLDAAPPAAVPIEVTTLEDDPTLVLQPMRPLTRGHLHVAVVTTAQPAADGGCVAPSPTTRAILDGEVADAPLARLTPLWRGALEQLGVERGDVSAMTVFRVHDTHAVFTEIAADIQGSAPSWSPEGECVVEERWRRCELVFEANDFRSEDGGIRDAEVSATYALPVRAWLPLEADGPVPALVYGHGLNGDRGGGRFAAQRLVEEGFAVFSTDAVEHGDHPIYGDPSVPLDALRFLAVDINNLTFNAGTLQGNVMQTVMDRLQLIRLLQLAPDVDGDGAQDVAPERMAYWGLSLGGMLGSSTVALSDHIDAAVLTVAGGWLSVFVTDTAQAALLIPALENIVGGAGVLARWLIVAQSALDSADPATWGPHVLHDRLVGDAPDLLFPVSIHDDTVPPRSGEALARALGAPQLEPVYSPVALLEATPGPLSGNVGEATAAFVQFDEVTRDGEPELSGHDNVHRSDQGEAQAVRFFTTWRDSGQAEIIRP